jgi:hypothetical protein
MLLFAGETKLTILHLGQKLLTHLQYLPSGSPRLLHAIGFDREDWQLALMVLKRVPGSSEILRRLQRSILPKNEAALFVLAICGIARYSWDRSERPGFDAFWPIVVNQLNLEEQKIEMVASSFIDGVRALGLTCVEEGHHRVVTAFYHAGWPEGLLSEWFSCLYHHADPLSHLSVKFKYFL